MKTCHYFPKYSVFWAENILGVGKIERTGNNRGVYGVLYILCTMKDLIETK